MRTRSLEAKLRDGWLWSAKGKLEGEIEHFTRLKDIVSAPERQRKLSNKVYLLQLRLDEVNATIKKEYR